MSITPKWLRVNGQHPCPICLKPDYCAFTDDGALAMCMRVELGAFCTKENKAGTPFYLHRLTDTVRPAAALPQPSRHAAAQRADPSALNLVYDALLAQPPLMLKKSHRANLRQRGLRDSDIDDRLYRSLPAQGRARLARELAERFGVEALSSVPGFVRKHKHGQRYLTIAGAAGLLIPVRDADGRVIALKVRCDGSKEELASKGWQRYSYLSSTKCGGPGPGSPVHVPLGAAAPAGAVRVTEGELKADIATVLSGMPTISAPGAGSWRAVLDTAKALGPAIVRLAFDGDATENAMVARHLAACAEAIQAEGLALEVERWPVEHKGIDDALAAGVAVEVLTGEAGHVHVRETLALATVGEPLPPPSPLDRLDAVLADGGATSLFGDVELLKALARLADDDPARFACKRAQLKTASVSLRDLDHAIRPYQQEQRAAQPPRTVAGEYRIANNCILHVHPTRDGLIESPLSNFAAVIVEEMVIDDGVERTIRFAVEGVREDGTTLPRVEVRAEEFARMEWLIPSWGTRAIIAAGRGVADHLRYAIQSLSGEVPRRMVYGHLGWRRLSERWVYLHAGGALGADGPVPGIAVSLPEALGRYVLPAPPTGERLRQAVCASLALLDLGPRRITVPLLAAVYRAVLGTVDFGVHYVGESGAFKTETSTLGLQHFGAEMHSRSLPASWASTSNYLEALAFVAKDSLLPIDDFTPQNGSAEVARIHRDAERLFRSQGNSAGRQRMRRDGSLAPPRPPRGLILSTGEDVPRGQSCRARLLVIEIEKGHIDAARLTAAQQDAAKGLYAEAMAAFLRWLAPRYDEVRDRLAADRAQLRDQAAGSGDHARTPNLVADLALGLRYLLEFAVAVGALDADQGHSSWQDGWRALRDSGAAQRETIEAEEPTGYFMRLLTAAIASGRAHLTGAKGDHPESPAAWGWREEESRHVPTWKPQGCRIGWVDGGDVLLEPDASYAAAQEMAQKQGQSLPVRQRTLWKRLRERRLLASWDERRQRNTIRRTLDSVRDREVLHLRMDALFSPGEPTEEEIPIPF